MNQTPISVHEGEGSSGYLPPVPSPHRLSHRVTVHFFRGLGTICLNLHVVCVKTVVPGRYPPRRYRHQSKREMAPSPAARPLLLVLVYLATTNVRAQGTICTEPNQAVRPFEPFCTTFPGISTKMTILPGRVL